MSVMDVEIITIGDEIITGHTLDSNGAEIAQQLLSIGLHIKYRSSVGDSLEGIEEASRLALKRAKIIITTGGLGPTEDDMTKRAIVKVFKRNLIFHEEVLEDIRARYARRGIEMPAINQNQALLPQGAKLFPNKNGSALGICIEDQGRIFISLPGVPFEMKQILEDEVVPYLKSVKGAQGIKVIKLRTTGIVESRLAEMIFGEVKLEPGVRLAYLPSFSGVDLRIISSADDAIEAAERADRLALQLEKLCGKYIYGRDADSLEGVVGQLLADNDKTLAVAESCTGGELGQVITSVPGSSRYFVGSIVAYADEVKLDHLGINADILNKHGAVSEECALAMAAGVRNLFNTDYALSITGIAGPEGGTEAKPVGTIYIGLASAHNNYARLFRMGRERAVNRSRSVFAALEMLRREILDIE
jgi:nicotinamide-nucleotide amidase